MATVRIYKVAELLNTSSQEVIALLKRDHGIEVKSASSTIEEVVARQFVDRLARQRNISVPANASFADTPAAVVKGKRPGGKAPKPAMPAAPAAEYESEEPLAEAAVVPPGPEFHVIHVDTEPVAADPEAAPAAAPEPAFAETVPAAAPEEPVVTARAPEAPVEEPPVAPVIPAARTSAEPAAP